MNPQRLPGVAENIRLDIKKLIPEISDKTVENSAKILRTEKNGNKTYGGDLLAEQISLLSEQLPIPDPENWGWRLLYFAVPTTVANARKRGFLIPLSEKTLCDGALEEGISQEGFYFETKSDPEVHSETAAIYFVPK